MGQKGSSFMRQLACKSKKLYEAKPSERMNRRQTIEKFLRNQGFMFEGETLIFVDNEPNDDRNRAINEECHNREYISHLEHVSVIKSNSKA